MDSTYSAKFNSEQLYVELRELDERKKRSSSFIVSGVQAVNEVEFSTILSEICNLPKSENLDITGVICISRDRGMYRVS